MHFAIKAFYIRRCLRIFPLYYAVVFAITALGWYAARESFWWNVTYTTNIWFFRTNDWNITVAHFWSLAVEEQFYVMWPWIVLLVPQKWLVATISGLIVVGVLTTITFAAMFPDNKFVSTLPFAAWDALGGGALLATLGANTSSCRKFARWAILVGLPVWFFLGLGRNSLPLSISGACMHTAMVYVCVWIVWAISISRATGVGRVFRSRPLVGMGVISYALYILHPFCPFVWEKMVKMFGMPEVLTSVLSLRVLCCFILLITVAAMSWFLYEKPLNRLKARFPYIPLP